MSQKKGRRRVFRSYRFISFRDTTLPPHLSRAPLAALSLYGTPFTNDEWCYKMMNGITK